MVTNGLQKLIGESKRAHPSAFEPAAVKKHVFRVFKNQVFLPKMSNRLLVSYEILMTLIGKVLMNIEWCAFTKWHDSTIVSP